MEQTGQMPQQSGAINRTQPATEAAKASLGAGKGLLGVKIAAGGLLALALGYTGLCLAAEPTQLVPKTSVAGVAVGGMTQAELESTLQAEATRWSEDSLAHFVFEVLGHGGVENFRVQVPANYFTMDVPQTMEKVWAEGGITSSFWLRGVEYLQEGLAEKEIVPVYADGGALDLFLAEALDGKVGALAEESTANIVGAELELTRGKTGILPNKDNIKHQLFELANAGETVTADAAAQFVETMEPSPPPDLNFDEVCQRLWKDPVDAAINEAEGRFQMEEYGVSFDRQAAETAFAGLQEGGSIRLPLIWIEPKVKMADLEAYLFQDLLGSCTTNVGGSDNRAANVKRAAQSCNEVILVPGQEFSYNGIVGSRTSARGYLPAPAYVGGQTVQEIGGGICQVSSTLYLATLRANLEIVERHAHRYAVGYVPDGLDATVYFGSLDYRFRNNAPYPVKIVTSMSGRTLNINIYGTKTDGKTVEMQTEQTDTTPYKTVYQKDASVPLGSSRTSVTPYTGRTVKSYRAIYENGVLLSRNLESTSAYKSRDKVILVNPADGR